MRKRSYRRRPNQIEIRKDWSRKNPDTKVVSNRKASIGVYLSKWCPRDFTTCILYRNEVFQDYIIPRHDVSFTEKIADCDSYRVCYFTNRNPFYLPIPTPKVMTFIYHLGIWHFCILEYGKEGQRNHLVSFSNNIHNGCHHRLFLRFKFG